MNRYVSILRLLFFELQILVLRKRTRSDLANSIKKFSLSGYQTAISNVTVCDIDQYKNIDCICNSYLQNVSECFYGNYFHFVRQEPNYVFPLQIFVLSFVAAIE